MCVFINGKDSVWYRQLAIPDSLILLASCRWLIFSELFVVMEIHSCDIPGSLNQLTRVSNVKNYFFFFY